MSRDPASADTLRQPPHVQRWHAPPERPRRPKLPPELIPRPPLRRRIGQALLSILPPLLVALAMLALHGLRH